LNKYLVKALVSQEGKSASLRFIPLEIFDLWKSYMQNVHDYLVRALQVSLWVPVEALEGPSPAHFAAGQREAVVNVSLKKKVGSVTMPVERYFAEEELDKILPRFLAHYGIQADDAQCRSRVQTMRGYFLQPEVMFEDELLGG